MAPKLRVARPCTADWEDMAGDDSVRYCTQCNLHVYNFGAMTDREVKRLIREHEGRRLCGRLYRRSDGTVITKDCRAGFIPTMAQASRLAVAALSAAMSACIASAQTLPRPLVQIAEAKGSIALKVLDPAGAIMPGVSITLSGKNLERPIPGTTDDKGEWRFGSITPGEYKLQVTSTGFQTNSRTVKIAGHGTLQLQITMQIGVLLGEVVEVEPNQNPVKKAR